MNIIGFSSHLFPFHFLYSSKKINSEVYLLAHERAHGTHILTFLPRPTFCLLVWICRLCGFWLHQAWCCFRRSCVICIMSRRIVMSMYFDFGLCAIVALFYFFYWIACVCFFICIVILFIYLIIFLKKWRSYALVDLSPT